jgi:DNA polymerase-3 subunit delta'
VPQLAGYDERARIFARLVRKKALSHAYGFYGDTGVGKATFAKAFARFLEQGVFKESPQPLIDCTIISPGEGGSIGIDQAREAREFVWQTPFIAPRRTAVLDGAELMTFEAQNALLKILEEPPPHALVIIVTNQPERLLPTLVSRMAMVYFPRLSLRAVGEVLETRYGIAAHKAAGIAADSFGSVGRALSLLVSQDRTPVGDDDVAGVFEAMLLEARRAKYRGYTPESLSWVAERVEWSRRYHLNQRLQQCAGEEVWRHRAAPSG